MEFAFQRLHLWESKRKLKLHTPLTPDFFFLHLCIPVFSFFLLSYSLFFLHWSAQYAQGCRLADKLENNTCHDESPTGCMQSLSASQPIKANEKLSWWSLYFHLSPQWIWAHLCFSLCPSPLHSLPPTIPLCVCVCLYALRRHARVPRFKCGCVW